MIAKQLCFPFEAPAPALNRLFFAILSPEDAASRVSACARHLRAELGLRGELLAPKRLHISLYGFGDYPGVPAVLVELAHKAGTLVSRPEFEIAFDRVTSFNGRGRMRPIVLRVRKDMAPLMALHGSLGEAMKQVGLGRWAAPHFTPHMTLLYDRCPVNERSIEPVQMAVRDFALVHSLIGQGRYIELARWPLHG